MKKKGQIWVSAVLYIALGMIIITLILSAGIPLINKMRDKNTVVQTKRLLFNIDANIQAVANEGLGSRRWMSPVEISSGSLDIEAFHKAKIIWTMTTTNLMMKPNELDTVAGCDKINPVDCEALEEIFKEGALTMWMVETSIEGEYDIYLMLDYSEGSPYASQILYLFYKSEFNPPLTGKYSFSIGHEGFEGNKPSIQLEVT